MEEEKIVEYHVGQAFFYQVNSGLEVFPMFCQGCLVDPCPPGVVYWYTLNLFRKFQFIGSCKGTENLVTIVGQHFHWLEFISKFTV